MYFSGRKEETNNPMSKPNCFPALSVSFAALVFSACATVKVKRIDEKTYDLSCKTSTDACQTKAWELCGGDFDTVGEDLKETTTESWQANPAGPGAMKVKSTEIRCIEKK
jgi:hypothetical protein